MASMPNVAKRKARTGLAGNCGEGHEGGSTEECYDGHKTLIRKDVRELDGLQGSLSSDGRAGPLPFGKGKLGELRFTVPACNGQSRTTQRS